MNAQENTRVRAFPTHQPRTAFPSSLYLALSPSNSPTATNREHYSVTSNSSS